LKNCKIWRYEKKCIRFVPIYKTYKLDALVLSKLGPINSVRPSAEQSIVDVVERIHVQLVADSFS
jgi:hypothetical protein